MVLMQFDDHLSALDFEGDLFSNAIRAAEASTPVPTCPGWAVRDLVVHQGGVHRWATAIVRNGIAKPSAVPPDHVGALPGDADLADWFGAGLDALLEALRAADPALQCFTFLADPPAPRLFWARRQAHETGMHRIDAESAVGAVSPVPATVATDGIDELLAGFVPRPRTPLHAEPAVTLRVETTDTDAIWHTRISDGAPVTTYEPALADDGSVADCTVSGDASHLYLTLWNRRDPEGLTIAGDRRVFDLFRDSIRIQWS